MPSVLANLNLSIISRRRPLNLHLILGCAGFRVWGLGFRVWGLGFRV